MKFEIEWRAFLNVNNEVKAHKLLRQIEKAFGEKIVLKCLQRYWKDKTLMEAKFETKYEEDFEVSQAVFQTMIKASNIGDLWSTSPPQNVDPNNEKEVVWTFEGICNETKIPGLKWISYILSTDGVREYNRERSEVSEDGRV